MKSIVKIFLSLHIISSYLLTNIRKPTNTVEYLNSLFEDTSTSDNLIPKESLNLNRVNTGSIMKKEASNIFSFKENLVKTIKITKKQNKIPNESKAQERLEFSDTSDSKETREESEEALETRAESESNLIEPPKNNSTNKYEGWLKIKSESFINSRIFPSEHVKFDKDFFRVNTNNKKEKKKFYFTLSENFLQYKSDEKSINLLQVIRLEAIEKLIYYPIFYDNLQSNAIHCADFLEKYDDMYTNFFKICSENLPEFNKFFCALAQLKSQNFPQCSDNPISKRQTEFQIEIRNTQIIVPLPSKSCNENFNYANHGKDWECLCKEGLSQSPIDLPKPRNAILSAVTPIFEFEEIPIVEVLVSQKGLQKQTLQTQIKLENEVLKISKNNLGKIITLDSDLFIAKDIIFHTPSEHTIEGKRFDMEMQVIYSSAGGANLGLSSVLVFLFEKKAGYFNKFIDDIDFYNLPNQTYRTKTILNNLFIPKVFLNNFNSEKNAGKDLIGSAKPFSFYTYEGSLTQPPCNEEAIYYIASEPLPIAAITVQLAQEALKRDDESASVKNEEPSFLENGLNNLQGNKTIGGNYRATQYLNGRKVYFYDHEKFSNHLSNFIIKTPIKEEPSIEKMKINKNEVINEEVDKPSGLPGSLASSNHY